MVVVMDIMAVEVAEQDMVVVILVMFEEDFRVEEVVVVVITRMSAITIMVMDP